MRLKKYAIGAGGMLVLVVGILLATGWSSAVAAQITNVFVTNDAAHAVPVHEQGTANVNVTNSRLAVGVGAATKHDVELMACDNTSHTMASGAITASYVDIVNHGSAAIEVFLGEGGGGFPNTRLDLVIGAGESQAVPLTQPLTIDTYGAGSSAPCNAELLVSGS